MSRSTSIRALCIASIAALFACSPVLVADENLPDPLAAGWNGEQICELLHEDAHQRILRCIFPPGVGHEKHFHKAHFGYVLAGGKMRIVDDSGEREVDLQADYSWTSDGISWHEVLNVGETTAVYLIVESF
ncbi:MAG: cupin domain-containing protein [Proteobacteria bacterium]|nr:cupin domain-containing protein [Pseudomonadota bacterium]